jgi:hypothetical protein
MSVSLPFFCRYRDGEVLIAVSKVLSDAFGEGIERAAKEDVVGGVWHDLHLKIYVNVIKGEANVAEAAVRGKVGPILELIPACRTRRFCGRLTTTSRDCDHNGHSHY